MNEDVKCFMEVLGIVKTGESFDYTRWQREFFDGKSPEDISREADAFEKANPYTGSAVRL